MKTIIHRHSDRTSISISTDEPDVDWIVTVTFDKRVSEGVTDLLLIKMAHDRITELAKCTSI